ncbi:MAG: hypothetical protein COA62_01730 [Rhodobiaceae bacterium]|nr:DUF2269 domain-containing protein [Rhodobiaceae bacterium]PCJ71350.1 MAG: hypothetical protein COA62_01730 [Rhodobiaceae bacterium]
MDLYFVMEFIHILSAAVLFGTGLGIAFFMFVADRTGDARVIAATARTVVIADFLFTATAVLVQPATGVGLVILTGRSLCEGWIILSLVLYVAIGAFWLPVVWLQNEMRKMAEIAASLDAPLPNRYHRFMRIWFWFGWPAFGAILVIFWLMVSKPSFA